MTKSASKPAEQAETALAHRTVETLETIPEYLKQHHGEKTGKEEIESTDIVLPRLGLCQALSKQRKKSEPKYIEGLEEGQLFNTVTGEIYGEKVTVVPMFFLKQRIKFHPLEDGGGIDCQSRNGKNGGRLSPKGCAVCPHSLFTNTADGSDRPLCDEFHNYVSLLFPKGELIVVSLKGSSLKVAKNWNTIIKMDEYPMYGTIFNITVCDEKNSANEWKQYKVGRRPMSDGGFRPPQEFFQKAEAYFQALREKNVVVDTMDEKEEIDDQAGFDTKEM